MKNPLSILSTAFVLLLSSISVSYSFTYTVTQLTNNTSWDSEPRINSNKADVASSWKVYGLWYQDGATLAWTKIDPLPAYSLTAGDVTGHSSSRILVIEAGSALSSRSLNVLKKSKKDRRLSISGPFLSGRNLSQRVETGLPITY